MTKLLTQTTLRLAFFGLIAASAKADIAVPPITQQLQRASVVAVGRLIITEGETQSVTFVPSSVIKGAIKVNESYPFDSPSTEIRNTIPQIVTTTNGKPFMLVAQKDPQSQTLWPIYGTSSAWPSPQPQELSEDYRKPETLEKCVALATSVLGKGDVNSPKSASTPEVPVSGSLDQQPSAPRLESEIPASIESSQGRIQPTAASVKNQPISLKWLSVAMVLIAASISAIWLLIKKRS